jgi:acyl carrier protein
MSMLTERLMTLLTDKVGVFEEDLRPDATFDELDLDSLVLIEFALILKKEFGIQLEDGELSPELSVAQTADLLAARGVTA